MNITKKFAIGGNVMANGECVMKLIRNGSAVAVYLPCGYDIAPIVITSDLRAKCDAFKAKYGLVEIK